MKMKKKMKNLITANEEVLSTDPYVIEIPVKLHERVRISGYIRTSENENKDGAIIIFDLGDHEIEEDILKDHGLKQSKIGIYRYLPMGKEFEIWTVDIFIPVKIESIRVSFKTWKNNEDIMIGRNLNITKDYAYSKIYKEMLACRAEERA